MGKQKPEPGWGVKNPGHANPMLTAQCEYPCFSNYTDAYLVTCMPYFSLD